MECVSLEDLPTPVLLLLANIGETFSTDTTKFEGKTPIFAPSFPFHQPSSTYRTWKERNNVNNQYKFQPCFMYVKLPLPKIR